jgi:3-oxoacyl-[acyl-carrier-protein] synthase II
MSFKRVVITGMGALTPIGNDVSTFWTNLVAGVSGAAPITRFDAEKFRTRFACEIKGLDINNYIPRQEARKMDPFAQYAVIAADEAMKDAGFDADTLDLDKAGVIWGTGIGGLKTFEDEVINLCRKR